MTGLVRRQIVREPHREAARVLRQRQTPAEQRLWQHLRGSQLEGMRFRRQQPIGPYIVDFYCDAIGLVAEVDGPIHEQQVEYDRERDAYLAAHGLQILRFTNDTIFDDLESLLRTIRHTIALPPLPRGEGCRSDGDEVRRG
jgi:very-short-patch-repair endonuclease